VNIALKAGWFIFFYIFGGKEGDFSRQRNISYLAGGVIAGGADAARQGALKSGNERS